MEKSTVIGLIIGIIAISTGLVFKGASLTVLINPAAAMIIFAGTIACLFNAFPMRDLKRFPELVKLLFRPPQLMPKEKLLKTFVELSQIARREGILALENRIGDIEDPFLRNGLSMVIDGLDPEFVSDVLDAEIQSMQERHQTGALIFTQAGTYAPTLGVLGAVIGLVAALGNLQDIEVLGQSIAAAFIATLFGIFTGYVIWHPFANKLKLLSKQEIELRQMMIEGILSIQAGDSPTALEAKLMVFIPQSERKAVRTRPEV